VEPSTKVPVPQFEKVAGHTAAWNRTFALTQVFASDPEAIESSLLLLSRESGKGHGFSPKDKALFSPMAVKIEKGEHLTSEDLVACREHNDSNQPELGRLARYSKQLQEIARRQRN
jgi:hypothetical protein